MWLGATSSLHRGRVPIISSHCRLTFFSGERDSHVLQARSQRVLTTSCSCHCTAALWPHWSSVHQLYDLQSLVDDGPHVGMEILRANILYKTPKFDVGIEKKTIDVYCLPEAASCFVNEGGKAGASGVGGLEETMEATSTCRRSPSVDALYGI